MFKFFQTHEATLKAVFNSYSQGGDFMTLSSALLFARDYAVIPEVLPRVDFVVCAKVISNCAREYAGAAPPASDEDVHLLYPEFLETLGLVSFALARAAACGHLSMLKQMQGLLKATADRGAPWLRLPGGSEFIRAL
jgi:hypothetical protein